MGTLTYGKKPRKGNPKQELARVPDFFPAILTQNEWSTLQERLEIRRANSRGRTHSSPYLLSGIAKCGNCGGAMLGKSGAMWKGKRYRMYYCSRAMCSRAQCSTYNGHRVKLLEEAVLEYLGRFSNPELVREHLDVASCRDIQRHEKELSSVQKRQADLETEFMKHLDLLNREILSEDEFVRVNDAIRGKKETLTARETGLKEWLDGNSREASTAEEMPANIESFIQDFGNLDVRHQKAQLQTILKAVHVHKSSELELEFRGQ